MISIYDFLTTQGSVMFDEKIKSHEAALEKLKPKGNSLSSTEVRNFPQVFNVRKE
jgi:hypothetical protein